MTSSTKRSLLVAETKKLERRITRWLSSKTSLLSKTLSSDLSDRRCSRGNVMKIANPFQVRSNHENERDVLRMKMARATLWDKA